MLLGIDVGTSATKAVLIDEDGRTVGVGSGPHDLLQPRTGWTEQDAAGWWSATVTAVREAIAGSGRDGGEIRGIGFSGQMHGSVLLDDDALSSAADGPIDALRPPLLWNDQRTAAECAEIESLVGGRRALVEAVGNAALAGFTLPKLLWIHRHEPEVFADAAAVCLPKDFVRLQMTGALATDVGDAAGTLLFDVSRRDWHESIAETVGIDRALLPPVLESCARAGEVTRWAAEQLGVATGTIAVAGSGDNMAGAAGAGVVGPGMVLATLGTSGVIFAHSDQPRFDLDRDTNSGRVHTMCAADGTSERPGGWTITGCMLSAAGSLDWVRQTIAPDVPFDDLLRDAAAAPAGCDGLVFLPYLTGERCPHPDPTARGGWIGLTSRHTRGHLVRAVLEGVAFGMRQILRIVEGLPVPVEQVRLGGGGNRSDLWRQIQADVFARPVVTVNAAEGSAFGAALMAGVSVGTWPSLDAACAATIEETEIREPDSTTVAMYEPSRAIYESLYAALRPAFAAASRAAAGGA
jgi:xylulokinase